MKDYYRTFEHEFFQWRKRYSEIIPDNYVYDSYELLEPHYNSQCSYASEIVSKQNLLDPKSVKSGILNSTLSLHELNSPAPSIVEDNSAENSDNISENSQIINENGNIQDENNENIGETSISESEYVSLFESENNEIDTALLKLSDIHDKSFENNDLVDENNVQPIELQTENHNEVPAPKNLELLNSTNRIQSETSPQKCQCDHEKVTNNDNEIKSEILSQTPHRSENMEMDEDIKSEILSQATNKSVNNEIENILNDGEIKFETSSQLINADENVDRLPLRYFYNTENLFKDKINQIKDEVLTQNSVSEDNLQNPNEKFRNDEEIKPETSSQTTDLDSNIQNLPLSCTSQNNSEDLVNDKLNQINDELLTQDTISAGNKLVDIAEENKSSFDYFNLSESEKNYVEIDRKPHDNENTTDNILPDLNENSSSMDEEKMARIETQILLTDSEKSSIFEKNTEPLDNDSNLSVDLEDIEHNSEHDTSSEKDMDDIDELLSDIDISDEELKLKYKQALKNICDDSASSESSDSEKSYNSIDNFENEALQSRSHGKIIKLNILDEKSKSASDSDNLTEKFQKCVVQLEKMDFSNLPDKIQSSSASSTDDINKLLNISSLDRKRRRISTSSSNESMARPKKKHKSPKKRQSLSSSSSSSDSDSSSSNSDSSINSDDEDDDFKLSDENVSDYVPDISDMSSISGKSSDESSTDSSDEEIRVKKRRKSNETKKKDGNTQKTENGSDVSELLSDKTNAKSSSGDDWRNDPLLRFNLNDNKKDKYKSKRNSGSSDVEIIEDNESEDDDVIITDDNKENNDRNDIKKKKQKDLLEMINRKDKSNKTITVAISSESVSSDELSGHEAEADKTTQRKRRTKVMSYKELAVATKKANEEEKERMFRLTQRNSMSSQLSIEQGEDIPKTLILEYNMETKKPRIQVHPELFKVLKDHQKEGVKFMWDSCYESIDLISNSRGSGCVLAHCMGLGKTLQVVTLLYTLFSYPETAVKRALILAPITTIKNWEREFNRWLSKLNKLFTVDSVIGKLAAEVRFRKIKTWFQKGGVFIMSYSLFRSLTTNKTNKGVEISAIKENNKLREFCKKALLNPGPDILVCDEGHTLKNSKSAISQCISEIKTARRIMLTGTPMQNNLKEYYCMINLVKPNLLGSAKEFANRFENPIIKGQAKDSSASDIRMMKRRAHVLHKKLSGVVQRVEGSILKPYLPSLLHYIVFIKMSNEQVTIYKKFIEIAKQIHSLRLLSTYQRAKKISTHPMCLFTRNSKNANPDTQISPNNKLDNSQAEQLENDKVDGDLLKDSSWYTSLYDKTELERVECGSKLMIFFHILNQCEIFGDKLLAFSTSVNILNVVEFFLKNAPIENFISSKFENGIDYVRVDGSTSTELRDQIYENFNDQSNQRLRLLIATTKVTGLGLNLLGANRIVILDTSWNPSDDMQSVYRIYRFGQSKDCYVYSLVSLGAMEEKIYERCVTKQAISCRVVDQQQVDRHYRSKGNVIKEFFTFVDYNQLERPAPNVPSDRVLGTLLQKYPDYVFSYHEHDKLLQNQEDEELDDSEREAAWQEFEMEEERLKNHQLQNSSYFMNRSMPPLPDHLNPTNQAGTSMELQNNLHSMIQPLPNHLNPMNYPKNLLRASVLQNINNYQNIPSTSKECDEPEYILSDPLDSDRMEIEQQSNNESNTNNGNPFVNDNRLRSENINSLNRNQSTTLEQNRDNSPSIELPEPAIETDYVVVIED
ncbi:transcriptional regulator ATRX-like isoform X2 [Chrysoperla carnea]|uniref:transcriptional regulator ATRX-like isoform X2 n=1 Tax=Chrysoperla carnea TaxID=189513 RepID=UPI001D07E2CB|nr:transcriptional regulator ATRX-like isoform X2 [Chrysoperla carnea]